MPRPRDGQHFVEGEVCALVLARRMSKRAVMANVAAKLRQRNKNLARIRDDGTVRAIAPAGGHAQQRSKVAVHKLQRFLAREIAAVNEIVGQHRGDASLTLSGNWRDGSPFQESGCNRVAIRMLAFPFSCGITSLQRW